MSAGSRPLLSVTIPTWNRSAFLKEMVLSVATQAERHGLENEIEVVISDNASTDDTQGVVAELQARTPVPIKYHRNDANLGAIRNIIKTLELSDGQYWMLYGDDDLMIEGALPRILDALRAHPDVPVFIFEQEGGPTRLSRNGAPVPMSIAQAARQHFYYIGNAGVFAVRTHDAQAQLAKWGPGSFSTCWPQTQLAFAAMAMGSPRVPLLAVPLASSRSPYHGENTVYTAWYMWETTFFSLYKAALELRPIAGRAFFEAACAHVFSPKRVLRTARDVAMYTTFFDLPRDVAQIREATRRSLGYARGKARAPLLLTWLVAAAPRAVKLPALYALTAVKRPTQAGTRFRQLRALLRRHRVRRLEAMQQSTQQPRVYTSEDL